ncbi:N-acetylneuraminic acid mutarotase [Lewinella aquimaris]|uniref:N-acetylneuraminic acid mutarotase n=1 Tax=Neolewinella aquimaris TaxID=1835722 RepID=A0A840EG64_9BACT|nr:kelch motif-containing protein [Neolewinella aquimaris]MBB4079906.1 N-acetylneuraminic acid mutarotase [Neolewinella aquimaris]
MTIDRSARYIFLFLITGLLSCTVHRQPTTTESWEFVDNDTEPVARHEAAFVAVGDRYYLLGGRGIRPVSVFDTRTQRWTEGAKPPVEIHHFQPVVYGREIYLLGAMTGEYPGETPLPHVYIYNPDRDEWRQGHEIPEDRRRGGAGVVLHDGLIYLVCGIRDGHRGDHKNWLDAYDPATGAWTQLPDAPRPRDHFQAAVVDGKLYAAAGRTTVAATNPFANTIGAVDVYDINSGRWTTLDRELPTRRAGTAAIGLRDKLIVIGGESDTQEPAHAEVEALDVNSGLWTAMPPLVRGRHGTGVILDDDHLIMASGCGQRGGQPELADMIRAKLK